MAVGRGSGSLHLSTALDGLRADGETGFTGEYIGSHFILGTLNYSRIKHPSGLVGGIEMLPTKQQADGKKCTDNRWLPPLLDLARDEMKYPLVHNPDACTFVVKGDSQSEVRRSVNDLLQLKSSRIAGPLFFCFVALYFFLYFPDFFLVFFLCSLLFDHLTRYWVGRTWDGTLTFPEGRFGIWYWVLVSLFPWGRGRGPRSAASRMD